MNIFKAYYYGLKESIKIPKPVFLIYLINVILGILIAFPLYGLMKRELGYSESIDVLLSKFDTALFVDFIYQNRDGILVLLLQVVWVAVVYWIISIFLAGGIIRTLNQDIFTMTSFFSGAGYNFFRFLKISLFMVLTQIVVVFIVFIPAFLFVSDNTTEAEFYWLFSVSFVIWTILFVTVLLISDYSKYNSVLYDKASAIQSIKGGFSYVKRNFFKTFFLYLMLIVLPGFVVFGYFYADAYVGTHTTGGVLIMFFVQQLFIIFRIWTRIWTYASPLQMYTSDFLKTEDVQMRIALMNEWNEKAKEQQLGLTEISKVTEAEISNEDLCAENVEEKVITEEELLRQMREEEERQRELDRLEKEKTDEEEKIQKELEKAEKKKLEEQDKIKLIQEKSPDDINQNSDQNPDLKNKTKDNKAKAMAEVRNELKYAKSQEGDIFELDERNENRKDTSI